MTQSVTPCPCISAPIRGIKSSYSVKILRLAKESGCNVSHVGFLKLVVLAVVPVDIDVVECLDYSIDVETHVDKAVNQVLVVPLVSIHTSAQNQTLMDGSLTLTFAVLAPPPERGSFATLAWTS